MELLGQNGPQLCSLSSGSCVAHVESHSFPKAALVPQPTSREMAAITLSGLRFLAPYVVAATGSVMTHFIGYWTATQQMFPQVHVLVSPDRLLCRYGWMT